MSVFDLRKKIAKIRSNLNFLKNEDIKYANYAWHNQFCTASEQ